MNFCSLLLIADSSLRQVVIVVLVKRAGASRLMRAIRRRLALFSVTVVCSPIDVQPVRPLVCQRARQPSSQSAGPSVCLFVCLVGRSPVEFSIGAALRKRAGDKFCNLCRVPLRRMVNLRNSRLLAAGAVTSPIFFYTKSGAIVRL